MSEQALNDPQIDASPTPQRGRQGAGRTLTGPSGAVVRAVRAYPWVFAAIALLAISAVLVRWAGARPGYDPYGWLVWGKLTIHLKLDTNGAPSWKPLPFLFTVPFSLLGRFSLWLWMITAVAVSLSGAIFAWRIAWRLVDPPPQRRYAGYAAGVFAVAGVFGIVGYAHFILSAQSDTMIVALCLGAIDCWLSGRQRWAFVLWVLGGLGRPEVWPFLALHALWAWRRYPSMRWLIGGGLALVPLMWFGIPALTAKTVFVASDNALHSPRELHSNKLSGTISRFVNNQTWPIELAAVLAVVLALVRREQPRNRTVLVLAAGAAAWVVIEIAFALHGFPAVPRYLFEPIGVTSVLAGVAVGRILLDLPPLAARLLPRLSTRSAAWAAGLAVILLAGALLPVARARYRAEHKDLNHERARTREINRLSTVVARLGPARILACGQPNVPIGYQSVFAWYMDIKTGVLYVAPKHLKAHPHTTVDFFALSNGWHVFPNHVNAATAPHCHGLRLRYQQP
ncbi:MAG: hypothetical protein M3Z06_09870 [Actinomycetota bacterium]|nr:hypothetical protein [Actinomycetota bacterium]